MSAVHERSCHCQKENACLKHTGPRKLFRRIAQNSEPIKTLFSSYTKKEKKRKNWKEKTYKLLFIRDWICKGYGHGLFRYLGYSHYIHCCNFRRRRQELLLNITNNKTRKVQVRVMLRHPFLENIKTFHVVPTQLV